MTTIVPPNLLNSGAAANGTVLTADGSGGASYQAAGGGAWNFVASQVLGAAGDTLGLIDCFDSTYDRYHLHVAMKRDATAAGNEPVMQFSDDSGSTYETTNFTYNGWRATTAAPSTVSQSGRNPFELMNGAGLQTAGSSWGIFDIELTMAGLEGVGDVGLRVHGHEIVNFGATTVGDNIYHSGFTNLSVAIDSFRIFINNTGSPETGAIASGSYVYCYGLAKS